MSDSVEASRGHRPAAGGALVAQLRWFVRMRWVAGAAVLAAAMLDWQTLGWYGRAPLMAGLGAVILVYNLILRGLIAPRALSGRRALFMLSWVQILLDLLCLTTLAIWTGGAASPLLGFYVFHMVFASLLLNRRMAYTAAGASGLMLGLGLWLSEQFPHDRRERLVLIGWIITLALTVHLANRIVRGLRRQRRRLVRQNRRIRAMDVQLRRHQHALIQHEKMVAMGQMAAGVTHEIANPLASMDSVLQLLERRPERLTPERVGTLRQQVERINRIIKQMKAFAHPQELDRQAMSLNEAVEQALDVLRFDPRLNAVQLERDFSPDAGSLPLLPQSLQQVLVNLIGNALDAMEGAAQPRLMVRTARQEGVCIVEVSDNGSGIAPEHLTRLFEPFFTTKPVGKGTGLGLSISDSLIQRQGGSISVKSRPGEGTRFTIRLPGAEAGVAGGVGDAAKR